MPMRHRTRLVVIKECLRLIFCPNVKAVRVGAHSLDPTPPPAPAHLHPSSRSNLRFWRVNRRSPQAESDEQQAADAQKN